MRPPLLKQTPLTDRGDFISEWWFQSLSRILGRMAQAFAQTGPPAAGSTWDVTHGLGTADVVVQARDASTGQIVSALTITVIDENSVRLAGTMTANQYRVTVIG